ncbi:hypothetical protein PoB_003666100 [Plakobranchus ocellatus]|uniref:Uncharacterized protein n=1 Tax=Plakobranchus ocellatus TaxID=259542 RepID=A0AAV4AUC9_9GAST|nr:hypothetical protein PoB_003666100 [Plakobranchus ocellatus]
MEINERYKNQTLKLIHPYIEERNQEAGEKSGARAKINKETEIRRRRQRLYLTTRLYLSIAKMISRKTLATSEGRKRIWLGLMREEAYRDKETTIEV